MRYESASTGEDIDNSRDYTECPDADPVFPSRGECQSSYCILGQWQQCKLDQKTLRQDVRSSGESLCPVYSGDWAKS